MQIGTGTIAGQEYPKFIPVSVDDIEPVFKQFIPDAPKGLRKNIVYSFQYLEYLDFILSDNNKYLRITEVLKSQIIKTFIITSISIIEGILYHLLCENPKTKDKWNTTEWKSIRKTPTNPFNIKSKSFKIENELFVKSDERMEKNVTLDQMIKIVKNKKLLGDNSKLYGELKELKNLRNRVHPYLAKTGWETDYMQFNMEDIQKAKNTIRDTLKFLELFDEQIFPYL